MSGLGVLAWVVMGAAAGWAVSRLMLGSDDAGLGGTVAGIIGAVLGGLGMRLLESPAAGGGDLDTSVAALAGSLWLTWITCVVTFGRRRQGRAAPELRAAPPFEAAHVSVAHTQGGREGVAYTASRDQLVDQLLRDAMAHDAGDYDAVGRRFDAVERGLPRGGAPEFRNLRVALTFWDGWIDARNRGWQPDDSIAEAEWPMLARSVAADLESDRNMTDARVVMRFDVAAHRPPDSRAHTLAARLRAE